MTHRQKTCTYIGIGHMGFPVFQATRNHFLANGWSVWVIDKDPARLALIADEGVTKSKSVPKHSDIVFLGVRPQNFVQIDELAIQANIVVSMMAGISCRTLRRTFPSAQVVRVIPNTPCEFGKGITPYFADSLDHSTPNASTLFTAFANAGPLLPVASEEMIDRATGLSAGGPAYMMHLANAMIDAGVALGFSPGEARALVAHTMLGSAALLLKTGKSPITLAAEVMTPNGTTERGVNILKEKQVGETLCEAIFAASQRARELSALEEE